MKLRGFALAALTGVATAAVAADEVKSLPGWDGELPSKHYSGYLPARGGENHVHYHLTLSEENPATDPITLWSNGGPGCTSLKGAFEEVGQLVFNASSVSAARDDGAPRLYYNPSGWTRKSSVLVFEHPTGVGFSYCDACVGVAGCNCAANDTTAALDNYDTITAFFRAFPELAKNDFFITGESYAGIYIPMLVEQIMDRGGVDNLVGAAIGNGCTGNKAGICDFGSDLRKAASSDFYFGGGFYSAALHTKLQAACAPPSGNWSSAACATAIDSMNAQVGPHNLYNMMDFCPGAALHGPAGWARALERSGPRGTAVRMDEQLHASPSRCADAAGAGPLGVRQRWCGLDSAMMTWLELAAVQSALNINTTAKATEHNNLDYTKGGADDLTALYQRIAKKYRLMIYNGQEDGCVPYNAMEAFTTGLGFPVTSEWHPWLGSAAAGGARVAAGYATTYGDRLSFVTVKGAGHEVPTYKPEAAFDLFSAFLNGTLL